MFQLVSGGNIGDACEMKRALEGRDICLVPLELNGTSCSVPRGWSERCHGPYDGEQSARRSNSSSFLLRMTSVFRYVSGVVR
ncbi:hypothetical protein CEXT_566531 [Caerostris extrusa]|uniref:Uncharacterized protein n=1 Tax=Caerostris extrusa TaxID=172846 RepID=A0AAV4S526_CAEEX|nr:hypothetical protein CEXT_566531 [Caerostris extrusa]